MQTLTTYDPIITLVLDTTGSQSTKRNYLRALRDFMAWFQQTGQDTLNKACVQRYVQTMRDEGRGAADANQRLSAIRKLAQEAADNGLMPDQAAQGIQRVKGIRQEGRKLGLWLDKRTAQAHIRAPNTDTLKGKRDQALLAVLIGSGLRRNEAASLTVEHLQQRDGRWLIVDIVGKRNKTRSVPIPSWVKAAIDAWTQAAGIESGRIFRPVNKGDKLSGDSMTAQAIYNTVTAYAGELGSDVAPHDLRRTFAKLAHKGGASVEQIQLSLGHASLKTTEGYIGVEQDLTDAPCDHLGLRL